MFESITQLPGKLHNGLDIWMLQRLGFSKRQRNLTWHYLRGLRDQVLAVVPISLFQWFVLGAFFQVAPKDVGLQVMGLFMAMFGLTMFLDGLRVGVMPLAEVIGEELPKKLALPFVLLVAFCLGILVTYAEPAISALRPLARLVDPNRAPYLYFVMNSQQELLVFAIGAGVGVAAVIGTLRFLRNWSLKPLILVTLLPTIGLAAYMQWGNEDLSPLIGMAWDCGAVTTGPVTVPVLLSLGIGTMRSARKKRLARAALDASVQEGAGQALEGFGIVTLASLLPIMAVQLMAIIDGAIYSYQDVLEDAQAAAAKPPDNSPTEKSPLREVVYGIRSILPLNIALIFIVVVVLRQPLPICSFWVDGDDDDASSVKSTGSGNSEGRKDNLTRTSMAIVKLSRTESQSTIADGDDQSSREGTGHGGDEAAAALGLSTGEEIPSLGNGTDLETGPTEFSPTSTKPDSPPQQLSTKASDDLETAKDQKPKKSNRAGAWFRRVGAWFRRNLPLLGGIAVAQIGMIAFNIGLTYAFTVLGDQTGVTLPAAFLEVPYDSKSPYYSYAGGLILVLVAIWMLGVLATRAEPALNVLGRTVQRLSGGQFTANMLINSVAVGVGIGMAAGAAKILYSLPIIYFILGKYAVAVALTFFTAEAITAVAWDSAGVTTGPVTVPFVLSIGVGFATAVNSQEGFGMLTTASVAPICSVLLVNLVKKPAAAVGREFSKRTRTLARTLTQRTSRRVRRELAMSPSFAMAAFASNPGDSSATSPDPSFRGGQSGPGVPPIAE